MGGGEVGRIGKREGGKKEGRGGERIGVGGNGGGEGERKHGKARERENKQVWKGKGMDGR